jgi:hypothetical protein
VWNFIIYTGQDTVFDESLKNEPYGSKVVLQLMAPRLNHGYRVIMNKWFSSPDLFIKLCSKQTDVMGTLHQNGKGVPAEIKSPKLKGRTYFSLQRQTKIVKWKDEKMFVL